jgi:hypothetical protein
VLLAVALADRPAPPLPRVAMPIAAKRPVPPPVAPLASIVAPPPEPVAPPAASVAPPSEPAVEPAWRRNETAAPPADGRPRIAIVIDDLGLDRARTERAIALPAPFTLSFMADAAAAPGEAAAARRAGHELLVHVPMEAVGGADIGAYGLAVALPRTELLRRLRWDLDRFGDEVGINNHMGSRLTADAPAMETVLGEVKARGLLFLDSRTTAQTVAAATAQRLGVPFAERDVFLDDEQSPAAIARRMADLEAAAQRLGTAIAIGHPHDATLAALAAWSDAPAAQRFALVPLSAVVEARGNALFHAAPTRAAAAR